jgi:hypothetical protein
MLASLLDSQPKPSRVEPSADVCYDDNDAPESETIGVAAVQNEQPGIGTQTEWDMSFMEEIDQMMIRNNATAISTKLLHDHNYFKVCTKDCFHRMPPFLVIGSAFQLLLVSW